MTVVGQGPNYLYFDAEEKHVSVVRIDPTLLCQTIKKLGLVFNARAKFGKITSKFPSYPGIKILDSPKQHVDGYCVDRALAAFNLPPLNRPFPDLKTVYKVASNLILIQ